MANTITPDTLLAQMRAMMEQAQQFPGQEKEVFEFYQKNPDAISELRAPIYEEKVVDYVLERADVKDKTVSKEEHGSGCTALPK